MSGFSIKAAVVSGLIGLACTFTAGASAQAASPVAAVAMSGQGSAMGAPMMQVNHRNDHYNRPQYRPNNRFACSPREATSKASRMGIRSTRVSSNRNTIRVSGFRHGRPATVVFGKARGCPILR